MTETALTVREREILAFVDRDRLTNKEIGDVLHLDVSTVKRHMYSPIAALMRQAAARAFW